MGLVKQTFVDQQTVITAEQMNAIQDAIIKNEQDIESLSGGSNAPTIELNRVTDAKGSGVEITAHNAGDGINEQVAVVYDGKDGYSPVVEVSKVDGVSTVSVKNSGGTTSVEILDGEPGSDGQDGKDGTSPTVSVSTITGGHRITITDVNGTKTVDVMDGKDGASASVDSDVPDYVKTEADRVAKEVLSKQNPNTFTFLAISDMHQHLSNSQIMESNTHAGQGMDLVRQAVHVDFGVVLGDNGWGSGVENDASRATLDLGIEEIRSANKCIDASMRGIQNFRVPGNHCSLIYNYSFNGNAYLDNNRIFPLYGAYNADVVWHDGEKDRGYCYKDIDEHKIRVICMNTSDIKESVLSGSTADIYMSGTQMQWFAETIDLSDKEDAAEWGIIILSHCPLDFSIQIKCCEILKAYLEGTSVSFVRDGITVSYDYSGKNDATIIGNIHGHNHNYLVDNLRYLTGEKNAAGQYATLPIDILRIGIPNACFQRSNEKGENNTVDAYDIEFGETVSYEKVAGTAEDTAFCVVTVDTVAKKIYATHYGAGYDRMISYAADYVPAVYTITASLTNCSGASGNATTISEDGSVTLTFTAENGYELPDTVSVTGASHSWNKANGSLVLSVPTGDVGVVVTAVAVVVEPSYTNLVPTAKASDGVAIYGEDYNGDGTPDGYTNDMRLGSNGAYSAGTGFVATGFIQQTLENPIYIKGNELSSDSYTRLYTFKTYVGGITSFANCVGSRSGDTNSFDYWFTVETLGDKYYKLTPTQALFDRANEFSVSGHYYYHLSIPGTGDTLIVTDNEPIE